MDSSAPSVEEPESSWDELYNINLMPSELFLKFRKEIQGVRVALNMEAKSIATNPNTAMLFFYSGAIDNIDTRIGTTIKDNIHGELVFFQNYEPIYNAPINECQAKLVFKPLTPEWKWKLIYEPIQHDVRILSKKIPITRFVNLQVGVGHSFKMHATGWKWKLTTCLGGDNVSRIRNKTSVGLFPGFDLRFGWRADYVLPELNGGLGTGEPMFNMQSGRLEASLDRVEAILTHSDAD